jgi:response regulator RpfG family c-di-GMP phosphodiesterase
MDRLNVASSQSSLVLLVDPLIASRHFMWRALSHAFGVIEAGSADAARTWIQKRPDIDALVVQDELPGQRGIDLVRELISAKHRVASRCIVLARVGADWAGIAQAGLTRIDRGDLRAVSSKLASWFLSRDAGLAKILMREVDRLEA